MLVFVVGVFPLLDNLDRDARYITDPKCCDKFSVGFGKQLEAMLMTHRNVICRILYIFICEQSANIGTFAHRLKWSLSHTQTYTHFPFIKISCDNISVANFNSFLCQV